jgi:hypothetical protein
MKSKKAILMSETLKIILAVACIILLVYLAVGLYGIFTRGSEIEQAKSTLNAMTRLVNSLENGEGVEYLVTSPKEWVLLSFNSLNSGGLCEKNCICLCPKLGLFDDINYVALCKKQGICKDLSNNYDILIMDQTDEVSNTNVGRISMDQVPHLLSLFLSSNEIKISSVSPNSPTSDLQKSLVDSSISLESGQQVPFFEFIKSKISSNCPANFEFNAEDKKNIEKFIMEKYSSQKEIINYISIKRKTDSKIFHLIGVSFNGLGGIAKKGEVFCSSATTEIYLEFKYKNPPTDPAQK